MSYRTKTIAAVLIVALVSATAASAEREWVEKSNVHAMKALAVAAKYFPEFAGQTGVEGLDEKIRDLGPGYLDRRMADNRGVLAGFEQALEHESDAKVRQDLEILIQSTTDSLATTELNRRLMLPYIDISRTVFFGIKSLLDPQIEEERRPAAVVRLRRYAGLEDGYEPIAALARARTEEALGNADLIGPFSGELDRHQKVWPQYVGGLRKMLGESGLEGWREAIDAIDTQLAEYYAWVDDVIRARARSTPPQPPEIYADNLKNFGVTAKPGELIRRATHAFADIQNEMQALAQLIAADRGFEDADYRAVIHRLKEDRVAGDEILEFYQDKLRALEDIIRREHLVSLPDRDAGIEIDSEASSAAQPSPHLRPPRLIGNTGQYPVFVIPFIGKNEDGSWKHNDSTFKAQSWTLTAHEARPGHELQFSSMVENGVSIARVIFAFNSANVEGWGLYAEAMAKPYLPLDGQLLSLQLRLLRAARMFLDPMINLGLTSREEAKRVLMEDVVLDDEFAQQEIDRYSFRAPGQATAYYFGYSHLQSLRTATQLRLRDKFDQQAYHDFILAQGLLPPEILRQAVMEEFVAPQLEKS